MTVIQYIFYPHLRRVPVTLSDPYLSCFVVLIKNVHYFLRTLPMRVRQEAKKSNQNWSWPTETISVSGDTNAAHQLRPEGDGQERDAAGNPPAEPSACGGRGGVGGVVVVGALDGKLGRPPRAVPIPAAPTISNRQHHPGKLTWKDIWIKASVFKVLTCIGALWPWFVT